MKDAGLTRNYNVVVNNPVTLTASWPNSVNNYSWNTGSNTRAITVTPVTTGVTPYTVTDNFGCITDQFTVTASASLPVSLLTYDAKLSNGKVDITWSTTTETNNNYFTIERSANGTDFTGIGTVNGAGNSTTVEQYSFVDASPLTGLSHYRLSQTNFDGKKSYLGTKTITNNIKDFEAKVVSVSNRTLTLQINSSDQGNYYLRVYDLQGREWKNERINIPSGTTRKDIKLNSGVFIWEIRSEKTGIIRQKVIIQ
jgi:hypothetical protein